MSGPEAEVFVVVRPDLTKFRAELEAQLAALSTQGIAIPINVGSAETTKQAEAIAASIGGVGAAAAETAHPLESVNVAMRNLEATTSTAVTVTGDYMAVSKELPPTLSQQAAASNAAAKAANDLLLAQKQLVVENEAVAVSSKGSAAALAEDAAAAKAAAAGVGNFGRGIASTGLSLFGLRGATLAATGSFLAGAAAVTAFAKAIGSAVSFDQELATLGATTQATGKQLQEASDAARKLGRDITLPGVSAQDAVVTITELAKAGLTLEQSMEGARGALQLATAAGIDNAHAVELVASALNAFELPGKDAVQVADALANSSNAAQGSIVDIGIALHQSAAVAHQAGLSFSTTVAFLTALARAGLSASDAGTSLRTGLLRLINPTKAAQAILLKLGISLRDARGNLRADVFSQIGEAVSKMGHAQRDATLAILGGSDAIRSYAILSKFTAAEVAALTSQIDTQGTAAALAAARTQGLAGQGEQLKNNLSDLGISLGHILTPALVGITGALNTLLQDLGQLRDAFEVVIDPAKRFADALGLSSAASKGLHLGILATISPLAAYAEGVKLVVHHFTQHHAAAQVATLDLQALSVNSFFLQVKMEQVANAFGVASGEARAFNGLTLSHITGQVNNLLEQLTLAQIAGASLVEQNRILDRAIEKQQEAQQAIGAVPGQGNKKVAQARRAGEQQELNLIQQRRANDAAIKAAADAAAAHRKEVAAQAQAKLDQADQDLLNALSLRRGNLENKLQAAGLTPSTDDDLKFQKALTAELIRERAVALASIHDAQLKAQTVQQLTSAITASRLATQQLIVERRKEQKAAAEARKQAIIDRRDREQESRELDVSIAEVGGNAAKERQAHQRLLNFLIERRKHTTRGTVEWKRLTLEIAQERKAIADANDEQNKLAKDFGDLQFQFLQTQAGFASNLLSNILPTSAFAGTVGGAGGGISVSAGGGGGGGMSVSTTTTTTGGGATGADVSTGLTAAGGGASPSAGQLSTLIHINRQMLAVLTRLAGGRAHPEAAAQKAVSGTLWDTFNFW